MPAGVFRTPADGRVPSVWRRFADGLRCLLDHLRGDQVSWQLDRHPVSVSRTRRLIRAQLLQWHWHGDGDVVELLATELVTNALRYAHGSPVLILARRGAVVRCEVEDDNPALVRARSPGRADGDPGGRGAEHDPGFHSGLGCGRGLLLVDVLAQSWGTARRSAGKIVWFELRDRSADRHGARSSGEYGATAGEASPGGPSSRRRPGATERRVT